MDDSDKSSYGKNALPLPENSGDTAKHSAAGNGYSPKEIKVSGASEVQKISDEESGRLEGTEGMEGTEGFLKEKALQNFQNIHNFLPSTFIEGHFREFIKLKSLTQSLLYYFFFYGDMTYEELGERIERTTDQVSTIARKPSVKTKIEKKNDERPAKYGITHECMMGIVEEIATWERSQQVAAEKLSAIVAQQEEVEKVGEELSRSIQAWGLFLDFIDETVTKRFTAGEYAIDVDFRELQQLDTWLANRLLDDPDEACKELLIAVEKKDYPRPTESEITYSVLLSNLPASLKVSLRDLRTRDLNKLRWSLAEIEMISDVRPETVLARFECPSCGNVLAVRQVGDKLQEPSRCGCGRKGKFKTLPPERSDTAIVWVTEPLGEVLGSANTRTRIKTKLQGDELTKRDLVRRLGPGVLIQVCYVSKELLILLKTGGVSRMVDLELHVKGIEVLDNYRFTLDFTEEEIDRFENAVAQPDFLDLLAGSAYPDHFGDNYVKYSLLAQLVSGRFTERVEEENLHVFIIGDPGVGKTRNLLRRSVALAPISHLSEATKSSTAGLIGSAGMKDTYTNRQMFEPGVLPRNNRGLVAIDELGALHPDDMKALNECMASGTCTIDKANIHVEAPADDRVLSAANPKAGRFDDHSVVNADVLGIEPSHLDRYDVICILRDTPNQDRDRQIAERMLHRGKQQRAFTDEEIRRLVLYARDKIRPELSEESSQEIMNYYVQLRSMSVSGKLTLSPRQLNSLRALTLCSAKLHLRETTTHDDVLFATRITEQMFKNIGYDITNLQRTTLGWQQTKGVVVKEEKIGETSDPVEIVKEIVLSLETSAGSPIHAGELYAKAKERGLEEDLVITTIRKLHLFTPKPGMIARLI